MPYLYACGVAPERARFTGKNSGMEMTDPFLKLKRPSIAKKYLKPGAREAHHSARAHSKFSASGAERWINCPGSVALSEGMPDKSSVWAEEGTRAHKVLEAMMRIEISGSDLAEIEESRHILEGAPEEMLRYASHAAHFILRLADLTDGSTVLVEDRIYLDFIHSEMFGTFDGAVVDHFGTLHVFDYKYGAGKYVTPQENLQMIFYGIGLAAKYQWNFKKVRLWIIQPRVRGYDGPLFWEIPMRVLRQYVGVLITGVNRVERYPEKYVEGEWCWWCKGKSKCPLKLAAKMENAKTIFLVG